MYKKKHNNLFRISLSQEDILLCERVFDADQFNPFTRYSIDIRDILPKMISNLQKMLSKKSYTVVGDVGNGKSYDYYSYYKNIIDSYKAKSNFNFDYNPQPITKYIRDVDLTIKGVECKIGLYINNNPIVEREFYVDGFNPDVRWSVDLLEMINYITYNIEERIKNIDFKNIWDDYDMINVLGINFSQIMDFSPEMRASMLRKLDRVRR